MHPLALRPCGSNWMSHWCKPDKQLVFALKHPSTAQSKSGRGKSTLQCRTTPPPPPHTHTHPLSPNPHNSLYHAVSVKNKKGSRQGNHKSEESVLLVCQRTEIKKTKEWEKVLNPFQPAPAWNPTTWKTWKDMRQGGVRDTSFSEKEQTAGSKSVQRWLSHQRSVGWFSVKQGTTRIQLRQCSKASLTMESESVKHSLLLPKKWQPGHHHFLRFNMHATESRKWNREPRQLLN